MNLKTYALIGTICYRETVTCNEFENLPLVEEKNKHSNDIFEGAKKIKEPKGKVKLWLKTIIMKI